ncbi:MAG: type II secretion system F family protein [Rhodospirillales bacterium]|nr:type II secretion system F family protein [Rhodospirillales bacterium]
MGIFGGGNKKRIKSVINQARGELSRKQMDGFNRGSAIRQDKQKAHVALVNKLLGVVNLQHLLQADHLRAELAQAGIRGRGAIPAYISTRILMAIAGGIGTIVMLGLMKTFPYPGFVKFIFAGVGAVAGFFLPKLLLANTVQQRQTEMTEVFPDALDLLVICVEAGLGVEAAFARVTEEIAEQSPVLATEMGLMTAELAYLGDRRQAYTNFASRTGMPSAKALATALIQSEQYGTPVGVALKVLAQEKRDERMSNAERKAAALPAKLTVPMIIFFLPVLFIVVIGPAALQVGAQ